MYCKLYLVVQDPAEYQLRENIQYFLTNYLTILHVQRPHRNDKILNQMGKS